jgi:REP element-mobilizing transposase RayT
MNKGIYNRGYLPHWDFKKSVQAITFRLADSVPSSVIQEWKTELLSIPDETIRTKELYRRIAHYEDAGHGSAILSRPDCAAILQDHLISGHPEEYRLLDWCIMPNHVHLICKLDEKAALSEIIRSWKGASAIQINRLLNRSGPLWQREYYDRFIRDEDHYHNCRAHIRNNPVKAKLSHTPEDWPFSSAGTGWTERWL